MPKKFVYPDHVDYRIRIQAPSGRHTAFRLFKVFGRQERVEQLKHPDLDTLNNNLQDGTIQLIAAKKEVELLVERLLHEAGVRKYKSVSNTDNMRVLERFWADYYRRRRLVDKESTLAKYRRAVAAIGELSLHTASIDDMQAAIDSSQRGNRQRSCVGRLKTILKWLGRGEATDLVLELEEESVVRYLTNVELERVLSNIENETFKLACRVARATGARIGELMAMRPEHLSNLQRTVFIKHQIRRDGVTALTKGKKADSPGRTAFVLPEGRIYTAQWAAGKKTDFTIEMRLNAANIIRSASEKAFPNNTDKHIKFHDLRHSYAIELCGAGVSLLQISQQIGNSERICQKHYTGFMATDETVDSIEKKLKKSS